ncbi:Uncharacterized protein PBTT_00050 [Plasmodiophora brassicae]
MACSTGTWNLHMDAACRRTMTLVVLAVIALLMLSAPTGHAAPGEDATRSIAADCVSWFPTRTTCTLRRNSVAAGDKCWELITAVFYTKSSTGDRQQVNWTNAFDSGRQTGQVDRLKNGNVDDVWRCMPNARGELSVSFVFSGNLLLDEIHVRQGPENSTCRASSITISVSHAYDYLQIGCGKPEWYMYQVFADQNVIPVGLMRLYKELQHGRVAPREAPKMIAYPVTSRPVDSDLETSTQRIKHASYDLTQQIAAQVLLLKALHRRRQNLAAALNSRNDLLDECRRTSALLKRDIGAERNRSRHLQQQRTLLAGTGAVAAGVAVAQSMLWPASRELRDPPMPSDGVSTATIAAGAAAVGAGLASAMKTRRAPRPPANHDRARPPPPAFYVAPRYRLLIIAIAMSSVIVMSTATWVYVCHWPGRHRR